MTIDRESLKTWIIINGLLFPNAPTYHVDHHCWYVVCSLDKPVEGKYIEYKYLHNNGNLYSKCVTPDGEWNGYYKTIELALKAIDLYYEMIEQTLFKNPEKKDVQIDVAPETVYNL